MIKEISLLHTELSNWCIRIKAELDQVKSSDDMTMYHIELVSLHDQLRAAFGTIDRLRNIKRPAA
jgi:hypothetical protein